MIRMIHFLSNFILYCVRQNSLFPSKITSFIQAYIALDLSDRVGHWDLLKKEGPLHEQEAGDGDHSR